MQALLVLLFKLSRDRIRLEVSLRFTQAFCIFSKGTLSNFLGLNTCAIRSLLP